MALLGLCAVLELAPARARACSCAETSIEAAIGSAGAIFEGVVESVEDAGADRVVRLAVTQSWRGASSEHVEVRTSANEASCGYAFVVGEAYLVYASADGGLRVSSCSRTRRMDEAGTDRDALGSGVVPVDIVDEPVDPVRPARTAPSRAGCASCAANEHRAPAWIGLSAALAALVWRRARA